MGLVLSLPTFFLLMYSFGLFDSRIEFENPVYMTKAAIAFLPLFFSFYVIGYMSGGHRNGIIAVVGWLLLFGFAAIHGMNRP